MLWKYCTQYASKFGKLNHSHRTGKGLFSFQCQRSQSQRIFKLPHNHMHFKASKVMLKILQARLQQYMNQELPDVQDGFRESRGTRDQIANTCWIIEKQGNSRKTSTSVSLTTLKPLTVWITTNCGKFLKRWVPDHLTCLLRILCGINKQQLELDMEQQTGSKLGRSTARLCLVTLPT